MNFNKLEKLNQLRKTPAKCVINLDIMDSSDAWLYVLGSKGSLIENSWLINDCMPEQLKNKEFFQKLAEATTTDVSELTGFTPDVYSQEFISKNIDNKHLMSEISDSLKNISVEDLISLSISSQYSFDGVPSFAVRILHLKNHMFRTKYFSGLLLKLEEHHSKMCSKIRVFSVFNSLFEIIADFNIESNTPSNAEHNEYENVWKHFISCCYLYKLGYITHDRNNYSSRPIKNTSSREAFMKMPQLLLAIDALSYSEPYSIYPIELFSEYLPVSILCKLYSKNKLLFKQGVKLSKKHILCENFINIDPFKIDDFRSMISNVPELLILLKDKKSHEYNGFFEELFNRFIEQDDDVYIKETISHLFSEKCEIRNYDKIKFLNLIEQSSQEFYNCKFNTRALYDFIKNDKKIIKYINNLFTEENLDDFNLKNLELISEETFIKVLKSIKNNYTLRCFIESYMEPFESMFKKFFSGMSESLFMETFVDSNVKDTSLLLKKIKSWETINQFPTPQNSGFSLGK